MKDNNVRTIWARGDAVINGWCAIPDSYCTELMAHVGFDSLTIDLQHGVVDYQAAVTMLQAMSTTDVVPLVRLPWNDPAWIMKTLDAGVLGVICPMINNVEQAEKLVGACKYPPRGYRSFGPIRAKVCHGGDYHDHANDNLIVMPQIETLEAIENIDEILTVPGIDGVYVGPSDLSMALGRQPRLGQSDPVCVEARAKIVAACRRHGVAAGIHQQDAKGTLEQIENGFQFVTIASDNRFLTAKANAEVSAVRAGIEQQLPKEILK